MAYQTGSATDQTDLMNKLQTFAAANGFTVDNYDSVNHFLSISRPADNVYTTFYWNTTDTIAMYQALGYSGTYAQEPWNQANDSGNGNSTLGSVDHGRCVSEIGAGSFTKYYFFGYTSPYAIHIVLEFSPGLYRHFAFGKIEKSGTWTGGAFVYGHLWNQGNNFGTYDEPLNTVHSILMDQRLIPRSGAPYNYNWNAGGTLHLEGFQSAAGQPAGGKWGHAVCPNADDSDIGDDRGSIGRLRIAGGCRAGMALAQYGWALPNLANGFIPIIPFEIFIHQGDADAGSNNWFYLGQMKNLGHIHLHGIDPAQELTVGAQTWTAFPAVRKSIVGGNNQESWNMGIIYWKDV